MSLDEVFKQIDQLPITLKDGYECEFVEEKVMVMARAYPKLGEAYFSSDPGNSSEIKLNLCKLLDAYKCGRLFKGMDDAG